MFVKLHIMVKISRLPKQVRNNIYTSCLWTRLAKITVQKLKWSELVRTMALIDNTVIRDL